MTRPLLGACLLAALLVVLMPAQPSEAPAAMPTPPAPSCDWRAEWDRTLVELGEDPASWFRVTGDTMTGVFGRTSLEARQVYVNPATPCEHVADVIRHEHMHLQQARLHGARGAREHYGERLEIVADCGSWLLGSTYTPYRAEARGVAFGCAAEDIADARELIAGGRTQQTRGR